MLQITYTQYTTDEVFEVGTLLKFKFRINGSLLFSKFVSDNKTLLNLSEFNDGVYVIQIVSGENVYVKKLVKR